MQYQTSSSVLEASAWNAWNAVHGASLNPTGARRRSILFGYFAEPCYAGHLDSAHLRNVRMDTRERFDA